MKEILSSQFDAVSGMAGSRWQWKRSSDNGGSGSSARGGNNGGDRGLQSFLSKTALMAAVPAPVVSGGMAVLQEMGMAAMALDRERPENPNQTLINS